MSTKRQHLLIQVIEMAFRKSWNNDQFIHNNNVWFIFPDTSSICLQIFILFSGSTYAYNIPDAVPSGNHPASPDPGQRNQFPGLHGMLKKSNLFLQL